MELKGERRLPAEPALAWEMLNDVAVLRACVPGAEAVKPAGDGRYDITMTASIGPVRARFKGTIELADIDLPGGYTLKFDGRGGAAGFARGRARITLAATGSGETTLGYVAQAQIGGRLAQVGSRLNDAAAGAIVDKFFEAFAGQLVVRGGPAATPPASAAGLWPLLKTFFRRLLGRPS